MDVNTVIIWAQESRNASEKIIENKDEQQITLAGEPEPVKIPLPFVDNSHDSIDKPYRYVDRNNGEILRNNSAVSSEGNKETCEIKSLITPSSKIFSIRMGKKKLSKIANGHRLPYKSKENISPKIKAEKKQNRFAFTCAKRILLRSSRERIANILNKNISKLNENIFGDDKLNTGDRSGTSFHSQLTLESVTEKSICNSQLINLGNEIRQETSECSLTKKDVSINQRNEEKDDANARIAPVNETTGDCSSIKKTIVVDLSPENLDRIQSEASPKKTFQTRERKESFDDEHVNKWQTENSILTHSDDYTMEHDRCKLDKLSEEAIPQERVIICTSQLDVNTVVRSKDETVHQEIEELCGRDNDALGNEVNKSETSPTKKSQKNGTELTGSTESKNEMNRLNFGKKYIQENCDGNLNQKLLYSNAQPKPVFNNRVAVSKNETPMRMGSVSSEAVEQRSDSDHRKDEDVMTEDSLSPNKSFKISLRNVSTPLKAGKITDSDHLSHVNAEKSTNKLLCIESVILPQEEDGNEDEDHDARYKNNEREEEDPLAPNVSVIKKIGKFRTSTNSCHFCTDSDDTLSNVESIKSSPTSPEHEALSVTTKSGSNVSEKQVKLNTERSNVDSILQRLSADIKITKITNYVGRNLRSTSKTKKDSKIEVRSISSSVIKEQKSKLWDGIRFSSDRNLSSSAKSSEDFTDVESRDNPEIQKSASWLRHYERPRKTQTEMTKRTAVDEESKRKILTEKPTQNSTHRQKRNVAMCEKSSKTKKQNKNLSETNGKIFTRKRGRPRKEKTEESYSDLKKNNKKARIDNDNPRLNHCQNLPATGYRSDTERRANEHSSNRSVALDGSALTILELQHLFFKFLQHGHFRIDYEQSTVNVQNSNFQKNVTTRMQCYDQKEYYMPSNCNIDSTNFGNAMYRTGNSNFDQIDHKFGSANSNLHNKFSVEFPSQMSCLRNSNPCNTQASSSCYENLTSGATGTNNGSVNKTNSWSYNSTIPANTNSLLNCTQSEYAKESNYQQDFDNNNETNVLDNNNSYPNCYSGIINSNDSMSNGNIGMDCVNILSNTNNNIVNNMSLGQSIQNQTQNLTPLVKMDSTMSNGNRMSRSSTVSMLNNSSFNDLKGDWNFSGVNQQQLDSTNEYLMEENTMTCDNKQSQAIDGISDINNITYKSNVIMNDSNLWMNRSNSAMNQGFSVLRPWHEPLPIYNPYLNNDNLHYGNMFGSCGAFVGFNSSNYPFINGGNNADPWMQNTFLSTNNEGNSAMHIPPNNQCSGMSSGSYQTNNFSFIDGMNYSMSSGTLSNTFIEATNMIDRNGDNLDVDNSNNKLNSIVEQFPENSASLIETNHHSNKMQEISQITDPYFFEYENCWQSLDFNGTNKAVCIDAENKNDNQRRENVTENHDYVNEKLDNFEECFAKTHNDSSYCKTVVATSNNGETELSKLRQELADFTKQYSENLQRSPDSTMKWTEHSNDGGKV